MFKNIIILSFALCAFFNGFSQKKSITDTTYMLKEASVTSSRSENFNTGTHTEVIDSSALSNFKNYSLNDLLSQSANLFVKSYGQGSLSTLSLRGTGSSHTAIVWNGFNLQSPMNGGSDISLISTSFIDNLAIQYGGSGALLGSGAIGGAVLIKDLPRFNNGLHIGFNGCYGSFSTQQQNLALSYGGKKFYSSTKAYLLSSENDFRFKNTAEPGNPIIEQKNASYMQWGILNEDYFKINQNQQVSIKLWYQNNFRELPPLMTQTVSKADQKDESYRITADWQKTGRFSFFIRTALFYEDQKYNDSVSEIFTNNVFITNISEFETKIAISKLHLINIGLSNTYNKAESEFYSGTPVLNRTAVFASYKFVSKRNILRISTTLRQEYAMDRFLPIMPSLGVEYDIIRTLTIKSSINRNYRLPTLNDMFWNPGGNPELLPEDGWSEDISIKHVNKIKKISYEISATGYNSLVNNWIIWLPQINFWSPENVASVWSRGVEAKIKIGLDLKKVNTNLSGSYSYTASTNKEINSPNSNSINKQLIYVPENTASISFNISFFGFAFTYNHVFTGRRYTTSDNSEYLMPYNVGSIFISKQFNFKNFGVKIFTDINNVWNAEYQAIAWRAMPEANFRAGIAVDLNLKPKTNNNQ
jgi:iron complex outermembrane receptor protein